MSSRRTCRAGVFVLVAFGLVSPAFSQTTTYYLHNENSSDPGLWQVKTTGPDAAQVAVLTADLKGHGAEDSFRYTGDTQAGVPGLAGVVPIGSTVTFTLYMRKTSANGVVFPRAQLSLNWQPVTATFCSANGGTALTTTLTAYTFSCTTTAAITMTTSDRVTVFAGYHMTTGPGNKSMQVELDIETTNSKVQAPNPVPPNITSLSATSGPVNWPVTISGTTFGSSTGTVKFNGTTATTRVGPTRVSRRRSRPGRRRALSR